jgi:hypothetical protein
MQLVLRISENKTHQFLFKISKNLKKISYQPRRNFFLPQIVKNLLPKWSVFVRIFYKNNSIFFCLLILLILLRSFGGRP